MDKSILMSIQPQWVAKILNGEKTVEVRKKFPKDYVGWVYIYCTKEKGTYLYGDKSVYEGKNEWFWCQKIMGNGIVPLLNGKVVAKFWCDKVEEINSYKHWNSDCDYDIHFETETLYYDKLLEKSCLDNQQLEDYLEFNGYAIHISKLEVFDKSKELKEFYRCCDEFLDCLNCKRYTDNKNIPNCRRITKAPQSYMFVEDTQ